jgi:hypothetical protein
VLGDPRKVDFAFEKGDFKAYVVNLMAQKEPVSCFSSQSQ